MGLFSNTWGRATSLALLAATIVSASCDRTPPAPYHTQFDALGTLVDISLWGVDPTQADTTAKDIQAIMVSVEKRWHAWHPSELSNINAHFARGEKAPLDSEGLSYLRRAAELSISSGNRFNPGIGQLIRLWGFASDDPPHGPPPPQEAIDALLRQNITMHDLEFAADGVSSGNPALQLDLGGWAKTIAIDGAVAYLGRQHITNAIVNVGGDMRVLGSKGNDPWRVGIRNPRGPGVFAAVECQGDESLFTSGDYERYFDWEGQRYQHIIDPKTGRPATGIASATVIHHDTALAEVASKAVLIAGVKEWRQVAANLGVDQVMLITTDMDVYLTPGMDARLQFMVEPKSKQVQSIK